MYIRFDQGPDGAECQFDNPLYMIEAFDADDALAALGRVRAAQADGYWLAGYASYELGYALEPKLAALMPTERRTPLLRFGVYESPRDADALPQGDARISDVQPRWDAKTYQAAFQQVHDYIGAGDIYQANLTFPIDAKFKGSIKALYGTLAARQPVKHGALILQDDGPAILSRSPELFFRTDRDGRIETRPMKGTMPRADDPEQDKANHDFLTLDEKNRAENLMIVDLLRNDISVVSQPGTVRVPELFHVESYATVHQMVSKVVAQLQPNVGLADIFKAMFPCGSITGAPKVRSMEVIRELEPWARDVYCGAIGWASPEGVSSFNVAIRTLLIDGEDVTMNVGGGVVWDSTADAEYEEALWKARYATTFQTEPV